MDLTQLIEEVYDSTALEAKREENGKIIAEEIMRGALKFVAVVEALGTRLTSSAVDDRIIGMSLLGHVLSTLDPDFLSQSELTFIVEFLHDRLKDQHLVVPKVILCILPIVKCSNLPKGSSSKLLRQLFQEANIQSHTQRHRRAFFLFLQHLLQHRLSEIKELGTDFVMSFLQAMDGEKDPRNLLLLFNIIPSILTNFEMGPFVEDFFEVLSMYFPIDFNPSIGGPDAAVTTRAELADYLHICMSQTNQFSEHLVPLALEKLESSVVEAKLDSLNLLAMCCDRSYLAEDLKAHLPSIWHALRREIFMGGNEEVESAANAFLRSAFKRLAGNQEILDNALKLIFAECKHHLSEPELRLSQPACRILVSAAEGSEESCAAVISMTLPVLYEQFTTKTSNPERRGILGIMITLMSAIRPFPKLSLCRLLGNWDEILWMWFSLLTHSHDQFILLALSAFLTLLERAGERKRLPASENQDADLDEKNRDLLQAHLLSIIQKESEDDLWPQIKSRVIRTMGMLSAEFPQEFLKISVPKLLELIRTDGINTDRLHEYLLSLSASAAALPVGMVVVPSLMDLLIQWEDAGRDYGPLVDALVALVEAGGTVDGFPELVSRHLATVLSVGLSAKHSRDAVLYARVIGILRTVVRSLDMEKQDEVVNTFWNEPLDAKTELEDLTHAPLHGLVAEAFLASVRPSVSISRKDELMKLLLESVFSRDESAGESPGNDALAKEDSLANIRLFATLINKAEENGFCNWLARVEELVMERLDIGKEAESAIGNTGDGISPAEEALKVLGQRDDESRVVTLLVWTVKALAMRGYENLDKWLQGKLIQLLNSPVYGKAAAEGFSTLMSDSPESLNSISFCNFRFLYKQRIFQLSVPKLVEGYRKADEEVKANFIRGLTGQLRHVPQSVLRMELNNVVPLLVGSLHYELPKTEEKEAAILSRNIPQAPLLISSLTALQELLIPSGSGTDAEKESPLLQYYLDLTPRLVRLAQYKGVMQVRILALQCLQRCAKFPTHVMVPIKEQVIRDLRVCLDDPKRLVRREAASCRNIWTLTNAPGGL